MTPDADTLPTDPDALRALLLAERAWHAEAIARVEQERDAAIGESARLRAIIQALQRHRFGCRSEQLDPDQLALGLKDTEQALSAAEAKEDAARPASTRSARRRINPGALPKSLPRIDTVIDIESRSCSCCGGTLHAIGEDVAERLDVIPAQFRVLVVRHPKYACRTCPGTVVQAPAPPRLIEGGLPTEGLVAHVIVGKYADHLPLYRQAQIYGRQGIVLDRSTLADWVGRAAWFLRAFHERLLDDLRASTKLFADETTAPVLDRGRGRTKTGQLWAYARDDRPWGGTAPPPVAYVYAPDRKSDRPVSISKDSAPCCRSTAMPWPPLAVQLAFCWAHWRRKFYEIAQAGNAPVATEALGRIVAIYAIEAEMRGQEAEARRNVRQQRAKPLVEELKTWLEVRLAAVSRKSTIAEAIRYGLGRWDGLVRFLDDGGSRSTPTSSSAPSARLPSITRTRSSPDQMAVASNGPPSRH